MIAELNSIKSSRKDLKNFGFAIAFILSITAVFLFVRGKDLIIYFFSIGSILIILGVIAPLLLKPIHKMWMIFAVIIGWIMIRIILSVLFFSIITIIGLFTRLLGKDF